MDFCCPGHRAIVDRLLIKFLFAYVNVIENIVLSLIDLEVHEQDLNQNI